MSKLKLHIILVLALWLAFSGVAAAEQLYVNGSGWWRDGGAFNVSETPIQAAVGAAVAGDAIYVEGGNYYENVDVDEPRLTLEGAGADVVIVTAASSGAPVFEVRADYVNISGFVVRGVTDNDMAGIRLTNADYCNISENTVYGNYWGICLSSSSSNTLTDNTANSNNWHGIYLRYSNNNTLTSNNANSNNWDGISLCDSNNNTLASNTANSNNIYGIYLSSSSSNTLTDNTANSNYMRGICLQSSSNNTLTNNTANLNYMCDGIFLSSSSSNTLTNNTANLNDDYGIYLYSSSNNNTLANNTLTNNNGGIYLYSSSNNNITCNWVQDNVEYGFHLSSGSTGNNISYNNIIKNGNYNTGTGGWEWQFYMDQYQLVEAKHNYWGAGMSNNTIDASIHDDEEGWGEVEFYPFETEPVQCPQTPEPPAFTTTDSAIALQIAVGSRPPDLRWDVSGDKRVTSLDALMILQAAAGSIEID